MNCHLIQSHVDGVGSCKDVELDDLWVVPNRQVWRSRGSASRASSITTCPYADTHVYGIVHRMFSRQLHAARIPLIRPLRPPNRSIAKLKPRLFTSNTQLLLIAHRTTRPQLPYLAQPTFHQHPSNLPHLARLLSTENKHYVGEQLYLAAKWTLVLWIFGGLCLVMYVGIGIEAAEKQNPTPDEWRLLTRWQLRAGRAQKDPSQVERIGYVDWAAAGSAYRNCLARLEDQNHEGKGTAMDRVTGLMVYESDRDAQSTQAFLPQVGAKSWPWISGYYETVMGCAVAAEHLDDMVMDRTRNLVFPKEVVIGPSNPDPRPVPPSMKSAPREEDCERPFDPPEVYYRRVLLGEGFTTKQKLAAGRALANWYEFKGLPDDAEAVLRGTLTTAADAMPNTPTRSPTDDGHTGLLKAGGEPFMTENTLTAMTSLASHLARTGKVSEALPLFVNVLRVRRGCPVVAAPLAPSDSADTSATTDVGAVFNFVRRVFRTNQFPPPPPSGNTPVVRTSSAPSHADAELMLYIGEILFATGPAPPEGLMWTREAVTICDANLQSGARMNAEERAKCKQILSTGLTNWESMLQLLSSQQASITSREGSRNAGWFEFGGWFGRGGGRKGATLDDLSVGVMEEDMRHVARLKDRLAREGIMVELDKARGVKPPGSVWIG